MFAHTSAISVKSHSLNAARWNPTASKFMEWLTSMITSREGQRYVHFCGSLLLIGFTFQGRYGGLKGVIRRVFISCLFTATWNWIKIISNSVWSNPVRGFEVRDFWRFGFSGFGPGFGPFLVDHVQTSGLLEGFKDQFWSMNLLGSSELEVQPIKFEPSSKFVIFWFDPTLFSKIYRRAIFMA